jgi:hypothetical protein
VTSTVPSASAPRQVPAIHDGETGSGATAANRKRMIGGKPTMPSQTMSGPSRREVVTRTTTGWPPKARAAAPGSSR